MTAAMPDPQAQWDEELGRHAYVDHALAYARRGWAVFPLWHCAYANTCACPEGPDCASAGKHPRTRNGYKDASFEPAQIERWWKDWPLSNIAIATGRVSRLVVLDIDGEEGRQTARALFRRHGRPGDTPLVITGSGGWHVYWLWRMNVRNRVRIAPGVDVRSDGGHVVAPPSLHESGGRWEWHESGHPLSVGVCPMPPWAHKLLQKERAPRPTREFTGDKPRLELSDVAPILEGQRNQELFRIACRLVWEERNRDEIERFVSWANQRKCSPPLGDREVEKLIASACRYL